MKKNSHHQKLIDVINAAQKVLKNNPNPFEGRSQATIKDHCTRSICSYKKGDINVSRVEFEDMVKGGLLQHLDNALIMYVKMYRLLHKERKKSRWHITGEDLKSMSLD